MEERFSVRDAVVEAMDEELANDPNVFLMGQDVGAMGGNFATTRGLHAKYGDTRVKDTPISEAAMLGTALGAGMAGKRPIVEIMFSSFLGCCMDELSNHVAQMYYMSAGKALPRLTLRTVNAFGRSGGCHHSGRPEAWLMHIPGLVVVAPSTPADTKGLLKAAIQSDDPVVFIENAMIYGDTGPRPAPDEVFEIGKAKLVRAGSDVTLLSYSGTVKRALAAATVLEARGIQAEVIDLRTLAPLDTEAIFSSVAKTKRVVVVSEDVTTAGVGAELCTLVAENLFDVLAAAPARVSAADVPVPFSPVLEEVIAPTTARVVGAVLNMMK